ncbi:hypothetical protein A3C37_04555 [Candidatus Peribacteria bacterium RIFCSPHIGHO2_02_FULL_53_20]|nr:MAG: hypothetical protein A3C37_04555 [Candidatus Peribacteria bacterium RIFCSPHIGHO2_02_FULL_53_20]OGJ66654.1 MAG: hypothetical protein A3B61_02940 [Candidatus Peribacteria bacterium RIFCSPLOWO2_01_FULL_53_10]OGJ74495.1 MAG: hypothetical protein A3G69_00650 [Candidatus Peribacteria bacterium RIFCSPLOWO2_12_FULL_53_10]
MERSTAARGRLTFAFNNFVNAETTDMRNAARQHTHFEILNYTNDAIQTIPGALPLLAMQEASGDVRRLIKNVNEVDENQTANQISLYREAARMAHLEAVAEEVSHNRWDILLLINSSGGDIEASLLIETLIANQKKEATITSLATTHAESNAAYLFQFGKQRIAKPDTRFTLHYPLMGNQIVSPASMQPGMLRNHIRASYAFVADQVRGENAVLAWQLEQAAITPGEDGRGTMTWQGQESPGYVTEFFDARSSIRDQLEILVGRKVDFQNFQTDVVARFALESIIEQKLQTAGWDPQTTVSSLGGQFHVPYTGQGTYMVEDIIPELFGDSALITHN